MKLMKKIAPFAASLLMLGATAAAADLATWKSSFPGADTAIVIGAASPSGIDTIGAVDLTAALTVTTTSTTKQPVVNAHLLKGAGQELNYNEEFFDIEEILDDRDLPTLLMDGRYKESRGKTTNDETYTQTLTFVNETNTMVFDAKEDGNEAAGTYLFIADNDAKPTYTYTIEFDNPIEFNSAESTDDDFKLSKLSFMGREYTITEASDTSGNLTKIVMMAGAIKATQEEYSTATYTMGEKTYTVEVPIISDNAQTVVLKINGETTDQLAEGDTYVLDDDTVIGVVDVVPNEGTERVAGSSEGNDIVTFYIGAEKVTLSHNNQVRIGNNDIQGSNVEFGNTIVDKLAYIKITYSPEDDLYVGIGESWTDPILGRLKYTFQGLEKDTETILATTSSNAGKLELMNNAGDKLVIPFVDDNNATIMYVAAGDKAADRVETGLVTDFMGNLILGNGGVCNATGTSTGDVEECEGIKFLAVSAGGEARVIKIVNIDTANSEVDLYDETTAKAINDKSYLASINLGYMTVDLTVGASDVTFADINKYTSTAWGVSGVGRAVFATELGADMFVLEDGTNVQVGIANIDDVDLSNSGTLFTYQLDASFEDMEIDEDGALLWVPENEDSDNMWALDDVDWGALFKYDSDDKNDFTIEYPEEQVVANVYISEDLTNIPELGTSTGSGIAPIAVTDDQMNNVKTKNIIAVGGSAVNRLSAELLGVSYPTYGSDAAWKSATGVDGAGKAVIKMMSSPYATGKYAMLVAGWEGTDTTRAAKVLREGTPALSGMSTTLNTATSTVTVLSS